MSVTTHPPAVNLPSVMVCGLPVTARIAHPYYIHERPWTNRDGISLLTSP